MLANGWQVSAVTGSIVLEAVEGAGDLVALDLAFMERRVEVGTLIGHAVHLIPRISPEDEFLPQSSDTNRLAWFDFTAFHDDIPLISDHCNLLM
jgi:hypothetical protein